MISQTGTVVIDAPNAEYGSQGGLAYKHIPGSVDASPMKRTDIEELRMRIISLEDRLAATHNASTLATKTIKAVYEPDSHALRVASPAPLGLYAFGLTTILLTGAATGWTEPETNYITMGFALFYGGLAQFCAGMWEFWRNNMFAGVVFTTYGSFWLSWGIFNILALAGPLKGAAVPHGSALFLFLFGFFSFTMWLLTFRINAGLCVLFFLLTCFFFLIGSGGYNHTALKVGGYFGVATGIAAYYVATAELTNEVFRKTILPVGIFDYGTQEPEQIAARPDTL